MFESVAFDPRRIAPGMSSTLFPSTAMLTQLFDAVLRINEDPTLRRDFRWFLTLHTGSLRRPVTREEASDIDDLLGGVPLLLPFLPLRLDRNGRVSKSSLKWAGNAVGTARFVEREARYPRDTRQVSSEEGVLGSWLVRQRRAAAGRVLDPIRESYLDYAMPTWRDAYAIGPTPEELSEQWRLLCNGAVADDGPDLGWVVKLMCADLNRSPSRAQHESLGQIFGMTPLLLPVFPVHTHRGGEYSESARSWVSRALQLAEFIQAHGRRPRSISSKDPTSEPGEQALRQWLTPLLRKASFDGLHIQRRQFLDVFAPGWNDGKFARRTQDERAEQVVMFVTRHGRWPKQNAHDLTERNLALLLSRLRKLRSRGELRSEALDRLESVFGSNWSDARLAPMISPSFSPPVA